MRKSGAVVTAVVALLTLAGCSDSGEPADDRATTTRPPAPTTAAESAPTTTTTEPCPVDGRAKTVEGTRVREFCGPARAVVRVGPDETHDFTSGRCVTHPEWFELHLGTEIVDPDASGEARFRSFTMLLGAHPLATEGTPPAAGDGTYHEAVVTFALPGTTYALEDKTVVLEDDRTRGSVAGVALRPGTEERVQVRGRFACTLEGSTAIDADEIEQPPPPSSTSTTTSTTTASAASADSPRTWPRNARISDPDKPRTAVGSVWEDAARSDTAERRQR